MLNYFIGSGTLTLKDSTAVSAKTTVQRQLGCLLRPRALAYYAEEQADANQKRKRGQLFGPVLV